MLKITKDQSYHLIGIAYLLLLTAYVVYRAVNLSITYDEVTSFQRLGDFSTTSLGSTANTHLLNSLLMRKSVALFGDQEFALRLPNVLGFLVYACFSFLLAARNKGLNFLGLLIVLTASPFLLDFFSIARGYGLSLAMMMGSIFFLYRYAQYLRFTEGLIALVFGSLAVLANYTLLNYFLPLAAVLCLVALAKKGKRKLNVLGFIIPGVGLLLFLYPILTQLREGGHLVFGGRRGFIQDTALSLGSDLQYGSGYGYVGAYVLLIVFAAALSFAGRNIYIDIRKKVLEFKGILSMVFLLAVASPILQHLLFDTNYLVERTAIFYYPLMMILVMMGLRGETGKRRILNFIPAGLLLIHFLFFGNLRSTRSWRYEADVRSALEKIEELENGGLVNLVIQGMHSKSFWYYKERVPDSNIQKVCKIPLWKYKMIRPELNPDYFGEQWEQQYPELKSDTPLHCDADYYLLDRYVFDQAIQNGFDFHKVMDYPHSGVVLAR